MSDNNIKKLINQLSKQLGVGEEQVKGAAEKGDYDNLIGMAKQGDREKIRGILSDPEKIKAVLQSPQAQELLKKYDKKK